MHKKIFKLFLLLLGMALETLCAAEPLLIANQTLWDENTTVVIANCSHTSTSLKNTSKIVTLAPPTADESFELLSIVFVQEKNDFNVYAVSSEQGQTLSILYRFELKAGTEVIQAKPLYVLPFGALKASLYFSKSIDAGQKNLPNYLVLIANESQTSAKKRNTQTGSYATLFTLDVVETAEIKPIEKFQAGFQGNLRDLEGLKVVPIARGGRIAIISGMDGTDNKMSSAIRVVFLESTQSPMTFNTNTKQPISHLVAVDQQQQNFADSLYAWDHEGGIWKLDLQNPFSDTSFKKIYDSSLFPSANPRAMQVMQSLEQPGIALYGVGKNRENAFKLFRLEIPYEQKRPEIKFIEITNNTSASTSTLNQHAFTALYARFGRLVLIPSVLSNNTAAIVTLERTLAGEKPLQILWTNLMAENNHLDSQKMASGILSVESTLAKNEVSKLLMLWDEKQQQEILLSLHQNCSLQTVTAPVSNDKFHRMSWHKK